jgi:thiol-disulfide isomerase/thioredoxin
MRGTSVGTMSMLILAGIAMAWLASTGLKPAPAAAGGAALSDPLADKDWLKRLTNGPMRHFTFPDKAAAAPEIGFRDATGAAKSLKDWRGKSVLVNFWAPWCDSCRRELPALQTLKQRMGRQDFDVLLIDVEGDAAKASAFLAELGIDKLVPLYDSGKQAFAAMAGVGVPTSVLIDCHGRELGRYKGSPAWDADASVLLVKALVRRAGCYDDARDKL